MRWLTIISAVLLILSFAPAAAVPQDGLVRREATFKVTNPQERGAARQIHGYRIDPPCKAKTAVLLQHGLSYTGEAWDVPGYSYARTLAKAGYTVVAIDRLGYGRSKLPNGYNVSSESYAHMTHQIVRQLRKEFTHVAIGGHSAGAEASELAAGVFGGVDALIAMGYHQWPAAAFLAKDWIPGSTVGAFMKDYVYFLGTPQRRTEMLYTGNADPAVVAADNNTAVLTPSGEILSIGKQPSRLVASQVDVPVFLQLAESDKLFPAAYAGMAKALFLSAPSVTLDTVPAAGHTYMLHRSGPAAADNIAAWLQSLPKTPACGIS